MNSWSISIFQKRGGNDSVQTSSSCQGTEIGNFASEIDKAQDQCSSSVAIVTIVHTYHSSLIIIVIVFSVTYLLDHASVCCYWILLLFVLQNCGFHSSVHPTPSLDTNSPCGNRKLLQQEMKMNGFYLLW